MTQRKIDDLFVLTPSSTRSGKRSRVTQVTGKDRDEFDELFETASSSKRRRTNVKQPSDDLFDFDMPSTSVSTARKVDHDKPSSSLKKKRSALIDNEDEKAIDELFNTDTRKKVRRPMKQEESVDLLDMFKTRTNTHAPPVIVTIDDFKTPVVPKSSTTQKKVKMFFDEADLISLREQAQEQNETKDYIHVKPVVVTGGQWLSKEVETKSTCKSADVTAENNIPDDQRNLMHIQYAPLILDDDIDHSNKKPHGSKRSSLTSKSSGHSIKKVLDGKSFQKQLVLSESTVVRKENLQSCYNALLEDINKPRLGATSSSRPKKASVSKSSRNDDEVVTSDDEQTTAIDFFDLPARKKKF